MIGPNWDTSSPEASSRFAVEARVSRQAISRRLETRGRRIEKTVPPASDDDTSSVPPCARTMSSAMKSPSPMLVDSAFDDEPSSCTCTRGLKMICSISAGMTAPKLVTCNSIVSGSPRACNMIGRSVAPY